MNQVEKATQVIEILQDKGYKAYFAGGYVRDNLLGKDSKDIDIVTSAKPDEIESLFDKTISVGKKFGIIVVIYKNSNFEIGTFRSESGYSDSRRPDKISFTSEENDAMRRDFTINAIFYDPVSRKYIDHVGGIEDIKKRVIRFIGKPNERIEEDNLRLIRAIRFKIALGFQYEKNTFEAVREYAHLIKNVSSERVRDELNKIMDSPNRHTGMVELSESQLLKYLLPEVEKMKSVPQPYKYHKEGDVFTHTYLALKSLPDNAPAYLSWAVMLHDIGKPETIVKEGGRIIFHNHAQKSAELAQMILERLKFSTTEKKVIIYLVENHMKIAHIEKMRPSKRMAFLTDYRMDDLIKLTKADQRGKIPTELDFAKKLEKMSKEAKKQKKKIYKKKNEKIFSGDDLIKMGIEAGPIYSEILQEVEDRIISGEIVDRNDAVKFINKNYDFK